MARQTIRSPARSRPPVRCCICRRLTGREADRQRFAEAFDQLHDIFDEDGGGTHLKPRTKSAVRFGYRRWLGWISRQHPELLDSITRVPGTPDHVRAYVVHLRATCRERTVATQVGMLHDALRYMYPAGDWSWLREIKARLERAIPKTGRKPILITSQRLVDASLARLDEIDAEHAVTRPGATRKHLQALALRYRDALLVAIAAFVPLRRTNLAHLMIGSTFRRGPGSGRSISRANWSRTGNRSMPTFRTGSASGSTASSRSIARSSIGSSTTPGSGPRPRDSPATGDALYHAFQDEVADSLGMSLTLHDTRRIAATTWAVHDPVNAAGAKDLLGDRSDRVFEQHYNLANGIQASRQCQTFWNGSRRSSHSGSNVYPEDANALKARPRRRYLPPDPGERLTWHLTKDYI